MPFKKFEYHLEAYFHSLKDEPFASFKAVSPFPTFSVGDWIDARAFGLQSTRRARTRSSRLATSCGRQETTSAISFCCC